MKNAEVDIRALLIPGSIVKMHFAATDSDIECVVLINHATHCIFETSTGGARIKIDDWLECLRRGAINLSPN